MHCLAPVEGLEPPRVLTGGFGDRCNRRYAKPELFGVGSGIRTHGFTVLQTVTLGLSAIPTSFGSPAWARSTDLLLNRQTLLPTELLGNCLVPLDRIELPTTDYKTVVIPFN